MVPESENATEQNYMQFLEQSLRSLILERDDEKAIVRRNASRALKHFPIQTRVSFLFNSDSYTTMEVVAQDQPGFLHNVALVLKQHNLILLSARIATFGERAEDIFYIRHGDHSPVVQAEILDELKHKICLALDKSSTVPSLAIVKSN